MLFPGLCLITCSGSFYTIQNAYSGVTPLTMEWALPHYINQQLIKYTTEMSPIGYKEDNFSVVVLYS